MLGTREMRIFGKIAAMDAEIQVKMHVDLQVMWPLVLTDINKMYTIVSPCAGSAKCVFRNIRPREPR